MDPLAHRITMPVQAAAGAPRSAAVAAPPTVEVVCGHAGFVALQVEWDALVARCDDQLFYRHGFLRLWLQHFASAASLQVLVLRDRAGRLRAALPLLATRTRMFGMPVRALHSTSNLHSCRFDLLAEDPLEAAAAFLAHLGGRRDWDVLRLMDVPPGGSANHLVQQAARTGMAGGAWPSIGSPWLALPRDWAQFERGLRARFRANLRRRRRRLQERGTVSLERFSGGAALSERLHEGLELEASGWKGRAGTAIAHDASTRGFYRDLAALAAGEGQLALWFLRLDGRAIAFQYALEHDGRLLLLKPAYDEALADASPGQLLMEDVLRDAIARGVGEFDFLGPDMEWKRDWGAIARQHRWLFLFRGTRGRVLHALKFRIAPAIRRLLQRRPR